MSNCTPADIGTFNEFIERSDCAPDNINAIDVSRQRLRLCARANLFRHAVDCRSGGLGDTFSQLVSVHESLGLTTRDPGLVLAINAHLWGAVFQILRFGTDAQKSSWLPGLLDGTILSGHAITEPQGGSDISALTTVYRDTDDGFMINGHKRYITNTPVASMMVVYAKHHESGRISAFMIKPDDHGAEFKDTPAVKGCQTATMGDVQLTDCSIPPSRLLGKAGAGNTMIQLALERERAFIFAGITGVMQWQLQHVVKHVKTRRAQDETLARYQAISHKIAAMKLRLDTSRLWIRHCAERVDAGKRITSPSAQAKLYASEAFLQSSLDAVQILGAAGLNEELTFLVEDALAGRLMSGSSEIQKNIIASMLGVAAKGHA